LIDQVSQVRPAPEQAFVLPPTAATVFGGPADTGRYVKVRVYEAKGCAHHDSPKPESHNQAYVIFLDPKVRRCRSVGL
jgi:hypothetical protein